MFSEINHSQPDDRLEISASMKSNNEFADQQPNTGDVPANKQSLTVIKIGGSTLGNHDTTLMDLVELQKKGEQFVVIHGGGKTISEWMEKQGIRPKFVNGLRVTDSQSLDIVVAVLTGVINKSIFASINYLIGRAIGISGRWSKARNQQTNKYYQFIADDAFKAFFRSIKIPQPYFPLSILSFIFSEISINE